jgi:hypothetical protein
VGLGDQGQKVTLHRRTSRSPKIIQLRTLGKSSEKLCPKLFNIAIESTIPQVQATKVSEKGERRDKGIENIGAVEKISKTKISNWSLSKSSHESSHSLWVDF